MNDYTEYEVAVIHDENADAGVEFHRYADFKAAIRYAHSKAFRGHNVSVVDVADGTEVFRAYAA
jgi:hypothetical protein